ncbi:MAG: hypothetical protein IJB02_00155 [Oscillospiraceae bacterium]|nr:hypothetical protein [Oscillospiraceae bacterium]
MKICMRSLFCFVLCFLVLLPLAACGIKDSVNNLEDTCIDGQCVIPDHDEHGNQVYAMVSPVGYHNVDMLEQAPRLDTLEGKTIALVGGSFMASTTHPELKKCILDAYPTATVYMLQEVGSGGPYSVFGQSAQTKAFQDKLKALGVDAVVSGNCGCGLCTTKESGSAIAAEYIGIPTVTVGAPTFIAQIHSTGVNRGVPVLRTAEYPGAFASHSTQELLKNTRETVFPQIVEGLTKEITQAEVDLYANDGKRPFDEIIYYGNYDEIQEYCRVNGWTDGLPVVPPTDEKVRQYLQFTPYGAEDVLGTYALAYRECTAYTVAANAVMAGVPAEYMPICIAFVKAMADGEWRRPLASTHGWSPYAWLNGPVARQLGIDHGQGMISEENNKALGRFIDLAMLNIGGYYVKENRMGTFGYLSAWTFSEDEEACARVGWDPYHVTQGYDWNDNTITAGSALQWGNNVTPATDDPEQIMTLMAWDITEKQQNGLGNTNPQVYRTVFITEYVARDLAAKYPSKNVLEDALIETARRPLYMRAYANYWANTGSQQYGKYTFDQYYKKLLKDPEELAALTNTPVWLKGIVDDPEIETIATMRKGQTPMLITGDTDRNKFQVMPGGGYITIQIELPENWDKLVAPLGYEPLSSFYIDQRNINTDHQKPTEEPTPPGNGRMTVPDALEDGTYRIVPSEKQMTEAGRIYCNDSNISYWSANATAAETMEYPDSNFGKLLSALGYNCGFTVKNGIVTEITLRLSTVEKRPATDVSALDDAMLAGIKISFSITSKQSKEAGGVTPGGTSLTLSAQVTQLSLNLGGQTQLSKDSASGFAKLDGNSLMLSTDAPVGATAKIGIKQSAGTKALLITKKTADTVVIMYQG